MISNTENLPKLVENKLNIKSEQLTKTNSAIKGKVRRVTNIPITPLKFTDLQKQWEEAEREPLPDYKHDTIDTIVEENEELQPPPKVDDSFEMNFTVLTTPAKSNNTTSNNTHTNSRKMNNLISKPQTKIENTNFVASTPKIQCSVNMRNYLTTPVNNLCAKQTNSTITRPIKREVSRKLEKSSDCSLLSSTFSNDATFKKIKVKNKEFVILNQLGKGGSSEVYQCFCLETKSHRAIKCVSLQNPSSAEGFINEVKMLQKLQYCDRVIKMYDFQIVEAEKVLLVVLEVGGADLSKIVKDFAANTSHMPLYILIYYWMEMLLAVKQIHSHGVVHADLKPANFLKAESGLKLIDFGISTCIQTDMTSVFKNVPEGSFNYISPEALNNECSTNINSPNYGKAKYKLNYKSDVWSLGCILYQMVYKRTPFQHINQMWNKLATIVNSQHRIEYPKANWVPEKIIKTIQKCLQYDSKRRPSIDELILDYDRVFEDL